MGFSEVFTSLVFAVFFTKWERGDGGNSGRAIRTFSENEKHYPTRNYINLKTVDW